MHLYYYDKKNAATRTATTKGRYVCAGGLVKFNICDLTLTLQQYSLASSDYCKKIYVHVQRKLK
jgi:hypothetical protein